MTSVLANPNIRAALERSELLIATPDVAERLTSACEHLEITPDGILEISRADWATEKPGAEDVLVVQAKELPGADAGDGATATPHEAS
jgi:hypothetical protein